MNCCRKKQKPKNQKSQEKANPASQVENPQQLPTPKPQQKSSPVPIPVNAVQPPPQSRENANLGASGKGKYKLKFFNFLNYCFENVDNPRFLVALTTEQANLKATLEINKGYRTDENVLGLAKLKIDLKNEEDKLIGTFESSACRVEVDGEIKVSFKNGENAEVAEVELYVSEVGPFDVSLNLEHDDIFDQLDQ